MKNSTLKSSPLLIIAEDVARNLARASETADGVLISTPVIYPSGAPVVIRIDGTRDRFFVADLGLGYQESVMVSASHLFSGIARRILTGTGISFDSRSFFVAEASRADLVDVVCAVANMSQRAVIETLAKHDARKAEKENVELLIRLEGVFGRGNVVRSFEIRGASSLEWEVAARVQNDGIISVFDYARPHKNSVVNTVAKFHDIARLPDPPKRIISVSDKKSMLPFLGLLSQAASVVTISDLPDEQLKKLAA